MDKLEVKFKLAAEAFDSAGTFEGHASVFGNEDSYGDIVVAGAFTRTLKNRIKANGKPDFPILWNHNPNEPMGVTVEMSEDERGLKVKGQLNLEVQRAREIYALMRQGAISGLSIGFNTLRDKVVDGKRQLLELRLWEWSPVTFPANQAAGITSVKSLLAIGEGQQVQQVSFAKEDWELDQAKAWLSENGFKSDLVKDEGAHLRFKQSEASGELTRVDVDGAAGITALLSKTATATPPPANELKASDVHALSMALKGLNEAL